MEELFLKATRKKLRWESTKGVLSVEDLWDLSLEELNELAKDLYKQVEESRGIDFLKSQTRVSVLQKLQFDVVKTIIDIKLAEKEAAEEREQRRQRKDKLLRILEKKEDEELLDMSPDDIRSELEKL